MKITRRQLRRIIREALDPRLAYQDPEAYWKEPRRGKVERSKIIYDKLTKGEDLSGPGKGAWVHDTGKDEGLDEDEDVDNMEESMGRFQPRKQRSYHQISPGMKSMANAAKRQFAKDYPKIQVKIDGRQGWIIVDGNKAVNISSANSRPMDIEDMVDLMKKAYLGHKIEEATLRIIEKTMLSEGTLYVSRSEWDGTMMVEDDQGEYFGFGEMILDLIKSGDDDIFQSDQGVDPENLEKMMQRHDEGVQGGMNRWDNSVFSDYYNVDPDRVLRLYARLKNHDIQEAPGVPDDDPDDGTNAFEEYYS